ncbi:hypothetical protein [Salinilacihabitans rarus]|uniref:hypothetical protein n=1 Tax=Salinilacihabitans rarus TaxID=2961596 RepID=UPI0020C833FF|nr:hypothetical protein [Salinilacihabitans rarus]
MTNYPSESSLLVNATQQQLAKGDFDAGVAIVPTQHEEAEGGYDIEFSTASRLELQYKAVYSEIDDRTFDPGHPQTAVKFPFNGQQAKTLLGRAPLPGLTFYALPVVTDLTGLGDVLGTTVFLDVEAFATLPKHQDDLHEYTAFWVPVRGSSPTFSSVYLKDKTEPRYSEPRAYHRIDSDFLYTWSEIKTLTRATLVGAPLRTHSSTAPTAGYQQLRGYESQLLDSRFPGNLIDREPLFEPDNGDVLGAVVNDVERRGREVRDAITQARPTRDSLTQSQKEVLQSHEYLLEPEERDVSRRASIRAALLTYPDDEQDGEDSDEPSPVIDYSGLDPRQGSRYRQYRYLAWGEAATPLTVPIGFTSD